MPKFLNKNQNLFNISEANKKRLTTKVQWLVESTNSRIKQWRIFVKIMHNTLIPVNRWLQFYSMWSFYISTGSKFSTSCRVDKNYIIWKSSKNWTRISNFLKGVFPSPQQKFFKIDSPAEIARIFRSLSFSERSIYFFFVRFICLQ